MNHNSQSVSKLNIKHKLNNIIAGQFNQLNFNSPNDMTMDSRGNIYFTDPNWQLGDRTQQQPYTGVYKIDVNGKVSLIDGSLDKPNGVALSPDQKRSISVILVIESVSTILVAVAMFLIAEILLRSPHQTALKWIVQETFMSVATIKA
ncbi:SMP-30/gluconolactonase/LRE family protein [Psychrosphaera sp. G1-22]|uniref:SMP-30/gluconolactonase/LRE family protein n=1 Tax=Psychrosphaera algicola TaxID=3023714 RepID=A0ABT5FI04_9GAMM|nr:SMP-30/gluconolactonase/LRE family protein [Psychrosphaera sp. G1-22]MDC2890824.1 SMP-30/gluconolactonase/LRE family protein [Psychrosphaera sp. G1-22]